MILEHDLTHYTGTVLFVSHDRYFINTTATRILDLSGQTLTNYVGNYDYYAEKKETMTHFTSGSAAEIVSETSAAESEAKTDWKQQKEQQARLRKRQNDLKRVEARIEELETRDKEIDELLIQEDVFTDAAKVTELSREKEELQTELDSLYGEWERLCE